MFLEFGMVVAFDVDPPYSSLFRGQSWLETGVEARLLLLLRGWVMSQVFGVLVPAAWPAWRVGPPFLLLVHGVTFDRKER